MSKSDTDSNSESYKSLSDEDSKMLTAKEDDSASSVESSDETVAEEMQAAAKKAKKIAVDENIQVENLAKETTTAAAVEVAGFKINAALTGAPAIASNNINISSNGNGNGNSKTPTPPECADDDAAATANSLKSSSNQDAKSNTDISSGGGYLNRTKYSRAEKKARRLLIKQGAKPLPNISRLVMRQGMVLFVIDDAEIYKNPRSDTFIVFGEMKIEDVAKQQENILACSHIKAAQSIAEAEKLHATTKPNICGNIPEEDEEQVDETGIDPTDIDLVMRQASTTRAKAVKALKANNNDIVNAIMELTM